MELYERMTGIFHSGAWSPRHFDVYTGGTFDLFHLGHVNLLRQCREIAGTGTVTVWLNTDSFAESYKRKPICTLEERFAVVEACRYVDEVVINWGGADSRMIVDSVRPNYVVVGDDWRDRDYNTQMGWDEAWLRDRDIGILFAPYTKEVSSSDIISRIK
jgi:glycerol-3-phosphate cytidylyltransferase